MAKKKREEAHGGHGWFVTFADLMALLLAFFVMLVAFSSQDKDKLKIVAGSAWIESGAGDVLARYCFYIPLLAVNGLTEAFVSSVATESEVNRQSVWMLAFSAGFAGAAYFFLRVLDLGAEGLVWANTLNMAFRIVWSTIFIASYMKRHNNELQFGAILPQPMTIAAGAGFAGVVREVVPASGGVDRSRCSPPCGNPHRGLAASQTRCGPGRLRTVLTGFPLERLLPSNASSTIPVAACRQPAPKMSR